jgi:hypothetical protein
MQLVRRHLLLTTSVVVALTALACGQGSATLSPTGPTASLGDTTVSADVTADRSSAAGVETSATLAKGGNDKGQEKQGDSDSEEEQKGSGKPEKVRRGALSGFVTATNGTSLTVRGVTVTPAAGAVIRHGNTTLTLASIVVGDHVQARGTMNGGTLEASEIKVEHTGKGGDGDGEVEGIVSGLTATTGCPVLTFKVGTTTVTTSAATDFDDVLCSQLANGAIVEVKGTRQADGSIVATKVELEDEGDDDEEDAKVEGLVSGLPSGTCPALTFTVGTKQVTTSASTTFKNVTCATLVNGMSVEVKGALQMNGSIAAAKVELD